MPCQYFKGISPLLSHITFIALGIAFLILVVLTISDFRENIQDRWLNVQYNNVLENVKNEIMKLNSISDNSEIAPSVGETIILGKSKINFPDKISNKKFTITLSDGVISVTDDVNITKTINVDLNLSGSSFLPAYLQLERQNNNGVIINRVMIS